MNFSQASPQKFGPVNGSHTYSGTITVGGNGITVFGNADFASLTEAQNRVTELEEEQKRVLCHQALKVCNYEFYKNVNRIRAPDTCLWATDHPKYEAWRQSSRNDLLWLTADPGCGKSVLARYIADALRDDNTVCYFYFKNMNDQDHLSKALCTILHQLFTDQPQLRRHAVLARQRTGDKFLQDTNELWRVFQAATAESERPIACILDALDECNEADRCHLIGLLCGFYSTASSSSHKGPVKVLATSRPYHDVQREFISGTEDHSKIWLRGDDENDKINKEINLVIDGHVRTIASDFRLDDKFREQLKASLEAMGHRTYLWLHPTIDSIRNQFRNSLYPNEVRIEDLTLPETVDQAYENLLGKVSGELQDRVRMTLLIITGARRPFTSEEMFLALGVAFPSAKKCSSQEQFDQIRFEKQIRDWCGLFVFIRNEKLFLIHQTAKEFLLARESSGSQLLDRPFETTIRLRPANGTLTNDNAFETKGSPVSKRHSEPAYVWKSCLTSAQVEYEMACLCVEYLCLEMEQDFLDADIKCGDNSSILDQDEVLDPIGFSNGDRAWIAQKATTSLYVYCADYWGSHLHDDALPAEQSFFRKVLRLYQPRDATVLLPRWASLSQLFFRTFFYGICHSLEDDYRTCDTVAQHLMAYNGHTTALKHLLDVSEVDWETEDPRGHTALWYAAKMGHVGTLKFLLKQNANAYQTACCSSNSALVNAVRDQRVHVVETLLQSISHVYEAALCKDRALEIAAKMGDLALLQILLAAGASLDSSALHEASCRLRENVVRFLIERGAKVNRRDVDGETALQALLKFLQYGFHISAVAARILQILIDAGAHMSIDRRDASDGVLALASKSGNEAVVRTLLRAGAGLRLGTALNLASANGHIGIVKVLSHAVAQHDSLNYYEACHKALRSALTGKTYYHSDHWLVILMLLESTKNDPDQGSYQSTLALAVQREEEHAAKVLWARVVSAQGLVTVTERRALLADVCDVGEQVVLQVTQQEPIHWDDARNAIGSLKCALLHRSHEGFARVIDTFLPRSTRNKCYLKLLVDHSRLPGLEWLIDRERYCVARYRGGSGKHWSLTIKGSYVILRARWG